MTITAMQEQDIENEQATLGSIMIDPDMIDVVSAILTAEDFYRLNHQQLFSEILAMQEEGEPADSRTLPTRLQKRGTLQSIGGLEYIMAIADTVPTSANAEHYAKLVQSASALRKLNATGCLLQSKAAETDTNPREVIAWLSDEVERLEAVRGTCLPKLGDSLIAHTKMIEANTGRIGLVGYTTGFSKFDALTGGFGQPMSILLKAARGTGKTHLLIQSVINCVQSGKAAVVYCMDTTEPLFNNRILAHLTGLNSFRINRPRDSDWNIITEWSAWLYDKPIFCDYRAGVTVRDIKNDCKAIMRQGYEIGLIAIDYAELLGYEKRFANHEQELSEVANGLKNLRDKLKTTILLLSQVNEQGGERWSKALGNLADIILTWKKEEGNDGEGIGRLWCEKNRFNRGFTIDCKYDFSTSRIWEIQLDNSDPAYPAQEPWWNMGGN